MWTICFIYCMTHAMTYLDGNFWKIMNCDSAIVIALKGNETSNASLWCRRYKSIIIARLVGFAIEWSQFTFDLSRATHYIRIMDSRNFFPIFELLCLSFWLIMFFFCLGPCLVWCGWARTDDHKGLRRRWTIETSNIHKSEKVVEETVTLCNKSNLETQAHRRVPAAIWCFSCNQIA